MILLVSFSEFRVGFLTGHVCREQTFDFIKSAQHNCKLKWWLKFSAHGRGGRQVGGGLEFADQQGL
jgi:hypothetical protein